MPSNPYYVFDGKLCKAEGMTKEQIINAIVEATGVTPQDVDAGFISTILETNNNKSLHIWSGTAAEYNALQTYDANTIYFINGDSTIDDLEAAINNANESIEEQGEDISTLQGDISGLQGDVTDLNNSLNFSNPNFVIATRRVSGVYTAQHQIDGGLYIAKITDTDGNDGYIGYITFYIDSSTPYIAVNRESAAYVTEQYMYEIKYKSGERKLKLLRYYNGISGLVEPDNYEISLKRIGL